MSSAEWEDECCRVGVFGRMQGSFSDNTALFFGRWSHSSVFVWCCCSSHSLTAVAALILSLCSTHPLTLHDSFSHSTALILSLCILPKTLLLQDDPIDLTVQGFFLGRRPYFLYVRMVLLQCCCSAVWKRALYLEDDPIDETMQGFFSEDDPIPSMYVWYFCSIVWKRALYSTKKSWNSWKKARHSAKEPSAQEWRNRTPDATRNTLQHTLQHTATHWNTLKSHSKRHGLSFCGLVGIIIVLIVPQKWNYLYYWYRWVSLLALYTWI